MHLPLPCCRDLLSRREGDGRQSSRWHSDPRELTQLSPPVELTALLFEQHGVRACRPLGESSQAQHACQSGQYAQHAMRSAGGLRLEKVRHGRPDRAR